MFETLTETDDDTEEDADTCFVKLRVAVGDNEYAHVAEALLVADEEAVSESDAVAEFESVAVSE